MPKTHSESCLHAHMPEVERIVKTFPPFKSLCRGGNYEASDTFTVPIHHHLIQRICGASSKKVAMPRPPEGAVHSFKVSTPFPPTSLEGPPHFRQCLAGNPVLSPPLLPRRRPLREHSETSYFYFSPRPCCQGQSHSLSRFITPSK